MIAQTLVHAVGVELQPCWFGEPGGECLGWLHRPNTGSVRSVAIVICNPIGYEYVHSYRSVRKLAIELAQKGFWVLRFDYYGMGDSPGDVSREDPIERWCKNVAHAAELIRQRARTEQVSLIGLRFGGTLAALASARCDATDLVLWDACVSGSRYVKEMLATGISTGEGGAVSGELQSAGFLFSAQMVDSMRKIDLTGVELKPRGQVLLVQRDDLKPNARIVDAIRTQGVRVETVTVPGYANMMAEPQYTEVPVCSISTIVEWLSRTSPPAWQAPASESDVRLKASSIQSWHAASICETLYVGDPGEPFFGVYCAPAANLDPARPVLVLCTSGAVHHVGPNRLYVELARDLAAAGFASIRFDLAHLGESLLDERATENHPYPAHATSDVARALRFARSRLGAQRFVLTGLCSGAHTSLHAALDLGPEYQIDECILINPLTFYWHDGMSLDTPSRHQIARDEKYYSGSVRSIDKWKKLLRGDAEVGYIARFVVQNALRRAGQVGLIVLDRLRLIPRTRLGKDLARLGDMERNLTMIFSDSDPGYLILKVEARDAPRWLVNHGRLALEFIPRADHTFSDKNARGRLIERLLAHFQGRYT